MVTWNVTVDGQTVTKVFDVSYGSGQTGKIGNASVLCANNSGNRSFESGETVVIKKNGTTDFTGYIVGKPSKTGPEGVALELKAADKRVEFKYEQVNRVFYEMDTGEIIREAVANRIQPLSKTYIDNFSSLSGWSSDAPVFELGNIDSQNLEEYGWNFLFLGFPEGAGSDKNVYKATFTSVPSSAIPGNGQIDTFGTRILVNNRGQQFEAEVNLRDNAGNNYNWPLNLSGNDFEVYELRTEEATPNASIGSKLSTNGALEYRFRINGALPEARAIGLDHAYTIPFTTNSRNTPITTGDIQNTGNVITRRIDRSLFDMIKEFSTEDGYISYIDTGDSLHYEPAGTSVTDKSIDYNTTPVTSAEFNHDFRNITNKVTVQGANQIRVTLEDTASIQYYGISPREEPIVDKQLQTKNEAIRRGQGYLRRNAWDDVAMTFEVADTSYQSINIGDGITVNWPPENITGSYTVSQLDTNTHGIVTIGLTSTDSI